MKTSSREKMLGIITAVLLVMVLFFEFIFEPLLTKRKQLMSEYTDLKLQASVIQNDLQLRDQVERQYQSIKAQLRSSDNETVRTDDQELASFAQTLFNLQDKHGLKQKSFRLGRAEHESTYRVLRLNLELQGQLNRMLRFIQTVETSAEPWKIDHCDIRACDQKDMIQAIFEISKIVASS